jgi:hypothetical protein
MFEWFTIVFAEPKEQAKLFTIIVSTVLAIMILLLNQWFISRRGRKDRLIVKLEELTTAVHGFSTSCSDASKLLFLELRDADKKIQEYKSFSAQIDTLCALYFQKYTIITTPLVEIHNLIINESNIQKELHEIADEKGRGRTYMVISRELNSWFSDSEIILKKLTKKHIK